MVFVDISVGAEEIVTVGVTVSVGVGLNAGLVTCKLLVKSKIFEDGD